MNGHRKTILIAEDHESNRTLLALLLEQAEYDVHLAADGIEALEEMTRTAFDAVITDWDMPRMNGLEFLAHSRVDWPETPVIVVSAHALDPGEEKGLKEAFALVQKPFESNQLLQLLQSAIQQSSRRGSDHNTTMPTRGE
ncbi:MAG TPA: response regulator [Nitrospira sp.]|nr:response regulator [Nitrospira sp.]